jgi:peptide/nickel transport system substrate-binding protein
VEYKPQSLSQHWEQVNAGLLSRREVLRRAMYIGLSMPVVATLLAACADDEVGETAAEDGAESEEPVAQDDETAEPIDEGDEDDDPEESTDDDGERNLSDAREFNIAFYGGIPDQDPQSAYDSLASSLFLATYEMLIRLDGESTFEYQPMLAQEWEANDELTEFTFTIPDNAMFHDGTVCDAEAVKRSFVRFHQMGRGPVSVITRFIDDPETQIEAVDEVTVRFIMTKPEPLFLPAMASSYGPFVVSPTAWEENATDDDPYAHDFFSQNMVGTGPYIVTEAEPQEQFILDRFDDYHSEPPFFERITARVVPEDPTRRSLVESGEVQGVAVLPADDYIALKDEPAVQVVEYESTQTNWISMNYALIDNADARRGFAYAFPYDEVNESVYLGMAYNQGPIADNLVGYDPEIELFETDLDRARELLEQGGVQEGDTFTMYFTGGNAPEAAIAELFQANLAQLGIDLEIQQVERSGLYDLLYSDTPPEDRPHFIVWGWWPDYNDSWNQLYPNFHSESAGSAGSNAMFYDNSDFDTYLDQMEAAETEEELIEATGNAVQILMWDDPGAIFYQQVIRATVLSSDIRGFVPNGIYINAFNFHEMWREA